MKVGILGTGFGAYHAELYSKMEEIEEIFVFGRNPKKLEELQKRLKVHVTDREEDLLDNGEIGLIDICLPGTIHKEYALKAMHKGKDVFIETPVAFKLKDAEDIRDAAAAYGRKACVNLFVRFTGPYEYLRDICSKGTYGKLLSFRIQRKTPPLWGDLGPENIVTELMIHDIDFITWLLGSPKQLKVCCTEAKAGQCAVTGLLQYEDALVELVGSSMMPFSYPFAVAYEAVFEEAAIRFCEDCYKDSAERFLHLFTRNGKEDVVLGPGNCYEKSIKHVIECIKDNKAPLNGIADAVASLDLALEIKSRITKA